MSWYIIPFKVDCISSSHSKGTHSFFGTTHDGQDVKEDVDDVGVKVKSCIDVFLWANGHFLVAQEKLGVHSQEL